MVPPAGPAILLVDDDPTLLTPLGRRLARDGYDVRSAPSGEEALELLRESWPALVVVDLMMPGMDGIELARRIKDQVDLPIIVLSAVSEAESRVSALEEFADDYLTKPFVYEELTARIQRVLRRAGGGPPKVSLNGGDLVIDLARRTAVNDHGTSVLTRIEVRLLHVLLGAVGSTVPTESLLARVWPDSDGADPSYVWVTVRRLRQKLEVDPNAPRYLLTERGVGYRLHATRVDHVYAG